MRLKSIISLLAFNLFGVVAYGVQFTANSDVCLNASCNSFGATFTGGNSGGSAIFGGNAPSDYGGAVADGGNDAFDTFGWVSNLGGLTLTRHTELLAGNVYRFFDTYTNSTNSSISSTVSFVGDLGSDTNTAYNNVNSFRQVSSDGGPGDPIVGFIWGNNSFASGMVRTTGSGFHGGDIERTAIAASLNVGAGQSISLMYFAFLASDLTDRSGDNALALATIDALFNSPNFSGLTSQEQARTLNWGPGQVQSGVPEPSTAVLTLGGLAGLALLRRRRS